MENTPPLAKPGIMIIDDNPMVLAMIATSLQQQGIVNIIQCSNGNDALAQLKQHQHIDILMLDLNMPDLDGIELLRILGAMDFSSGIVLFSGEDARILKTATDLATAYGLHVLGSIAKPIPAEKLCAFLRSYEPRPSKPPMLPPPARVHSEELRLAITQGQVLPYFQPKICIRDKSLVSAEVLARWFHPQKGLILPDVFIPLAEDYGLIDELSWSIYAQAFVYLKKWRVNYPDFRLSLNLSAESLIAIDLPEQLETLAAAHDIPCHAIELEITESRLIKNFTIALDVLSRLRLKGFHLSIDDFGTGYSSLSQLYLFPFSEFKIDRRFVHNCQANPEALAILETSAALAKKLNLLTVAEGIENAEDWRQVESVGCDMAQGYFIAKPMSGDEFCEWQKTTDYRSKTTSTNTASTKTTPSPAAQSIATSRARTA